MKAAIKRAAEKGTSSQITKRSRQASKASAKSKNVLRNNTSVNLGLGFPKRLQITHKYVALDRTITSTLGVFGFYRFSCNGLFDPDITGTGHQPMYFDTVGSVYDHYTVIGSKLTVRVVPAVAGQGPGALGVFINDDTTSNIISLGNAMEQSSGTRALLMPIGQSVPLVLTKTWSAKQTFGGSILGNDNLQGTIATNPSEQSYYDIVYQDLNGVAATSTVNIVVELEYITIWDELKDLAQQ